METKYNVGDEVLLPFKVHSIAINNHGDICYRLDNKNLYDRLLEVDERDICNDEEETK